MASAKKMESKKPRKKGLIIATALIVVIIIAAGAVYWYTLPPPTVRISLGCGVVGGESILAGSALAKIVRQYYPNIEITAEVTTSYVDNVKLLNAKKVSMIALSAETIDMGIKGEGPFKDLGKTDMRLLFQWITYSVQVVTLKGAPINSPEDLKGKKVSVGGVGSTHYVCAQQLLEAYGMTMNDIKPYYTPVTEAADALRDGLIDAVIYLGSRTPAIVELATARDIKLISLSDAALSRVIAKYTYYIVANIPAGSYKGTEMAKTFGSHAFWCVAPGFDEELAYKITKAIYEHIDEFFSISPESIRVFMDVKRNGEVPFFQFNPGAARYLKEKGIAVKT